MADQRGTALDRLAAVARPCPQCPLAGARTQVVFGVGDPDAALLFVGEGPGHEEDLAGEPFVGRSGRLLDRLMIEGVGPTPAQRNTPNSTHDDIEASRPYLEKQLTVICPSLVFTLGNFATRLLLDRTECIR